MNEEELIFLNALNRTPGIGSQKIKKLQSFFSSFSAAWQAELSELSASGIGEKISIQLCQFRKTIDPKKEWGNLQKEGIDIIAWTDPEYPQFLKQTDNPPFVLYKKGDIDFNEETLISIIGSRKYTSYGSQAAKSIAHQLSRIGITVVSGMALGIDSLAHEASLAAGGKTVAVLGSSLDAKFIYPQSNYNLSQKIAENGALLSEYPLGTPAGPGTFPSRNRIIAGLSMGTLIIEAGEKSGTLITANLALEYNREVMAIPGSIFSSQSIGTNQLLKNGARLVTSISDILETIGYEKEKKRTAESRPALKPESKEEEIILKVLSYEPVHIDKICKVSKLETASVSATLSMMEIKGWIKNIGGNNYVLI